MPQLINEDDILKSSPIPPPPLRTIHDSNAHPITPRKRGRIDSLSTSNASSPSPSRLFNSAPRKRQKIDTLSPSTKSSSSSSPSPAPLSRIEIRQSELIYPKSMYGGLAPQLPSTSERHALSELLTDQLPANEITIELSDFTIYRPGQSLTQQKRQRRMFEMVPLHHLSIEPGCNALLFNGFITHNGTKKYVQGVRFELMAIAGYVEDSDTVADNITLKSTLSENVWYHLSKSRPAAEYRRYHEVFLWVADLAKHAIDFMASEDKIALKDFQSRFYDWLMLRHGDSEHFRSWLTKFGIGRKDFRTSITANVGFIWNEAHNVNEQFKQDPIWRELNHVRHGETVEEEDKETRRQKQGVDGTVVTPLVYENFKHMPFANLLRRHEPTSQLAAKFERHKASLGFIDVAKVQKAAESNTNENNKAHIRVGDVVTIVRDEHSVWKESGSKWFAWIQKISKDHLGVFYNVVWVYNPAETTLKGGKYSFSNELFFSDHCNCQATKSQALRPSDILQKVSVKWIYCGAMDSAVASQDSVDYFIRTKYITHDHSFVTLKETNRHCACSDKPHYQSQSHSHYTTGDTVLVLKGRDVLDPVVVEDILDNRMVSVRQLLRRQKHDSNIKDNELVWTEGIFEVPARSIRKKCYIRFFEEMDSIPVPYDRDGAGNLWFIRSKIDAGRMEPLRRPFPTAMNQAFDPTQEPPLSPLKALDLFCGGGNFGRGLAEAGGIECLWAVDWEKNAVDTYRANEKKQRVSIYWGSVNDYLAQTINGTKSLLVAKIGDVEFIAAGNPCQAFSSMQPDTTSEESLRNASMVASVAAFVDVYRPKYALLENVVAMAHKRRNGTNDNIFPQLLCAFVAMGYQVQQFLVDAWTSGSPQSRSRLFISITAPGLVPLPPPTLTHSHPSGVNNSSLGTSACSAKFGTRQFGPTPFKFVTAAQAVQDLPHIGDSHVQTCIPFPDHHLCRIESQIVNDYIKSVPIFPPGMTLMEAITGGFVPKTIATHFLEHSSKARTARASRSYSRVLPNGLFPTIKTAATAADAWTGRLLHWQEHRVLTIMEARRAQSFPDDEVIVGTPSGQWRIIGNSVDRKVALNLGMAVRQAWHANTLNNDDNNVPLTNGTNSTHAQLDPLTEPSSPALQSTSLEPSSVEAADTSSAGNGLAQPKNKSAPVIIDLTMSDSEDTDGTNVQSESVPTSAGRKSLKQNGGSSASTPSGRHRSTSTPSGYNLRPTPTPSRRIQEVGSDRSRRRRLMDLD